MKGYAKICKIKSKYCLHATKKLKVKINVLDMPVLNRTSENDIIQEFIADLILQVLAFCADNERKNILERQKQGIECAKSRGVVFGRPALNLPENFKDIVSQYKKKNYIK